jgi:hypothetical protein
MSLTVGPSEWHYEKSFANATIVLCVDSMSRGGETISKDLSGTKCALTFGITCFIVEQRPKYICFAVCILSQIAISVFSNFRTTFPRALHLSWAPSPKPTRPRQLHRHTTACRYHATLCRPSLLSSLPQPTDQGHTITMTGCPRARSSETMAPTFKKLPSTTSAATSRSSI